MVRFKRRYFCVEINFQDSDLNSAAKRIQIAKLRHTSLTDSIHKSIERLYGDYGMATMMTSFSVIYYNLSTSLAILRTARDMQGPFHNVLTFTRKLDDFDIAFKTVHVSGSIKKCKKFLLGYCNERLKLIKKDLSDQKKQLSTAAVAMDSEDKREVAQVLEKIVECCQQDDNIFNMK
jgi:ribonuclease P/MRP protein subunit POP5